MFPPSTDCLKKFKSDLLRSYQMIWKKKTKEEEENRNLAATMEEAQILATFETFFFSPALKLLIWVLETFQEVLL